MPSSTTSSSSSRASRSSKIRELTRDLIPLNMNNSQRSVATSTGSHHGTISPASSTVDFDPIRDSAFMSTELMEATREQREAKYSQQSFRVPKIPDLRDTAKKYGRWSPRRQPDPRIDTSALGHAFENFTQGSQDFTQGSQGAGSTFSVSIEAMVKKQAMFKAPEPTPSRAPQTSHNANRLQINGTGFSSKSAQLPKRQPLVPDTLRRDVLHNISKQTTTTTHTATHTHTAATATADAPKEFTDEQKENIPPIGPQTSQRSPYISHASRDTNGDRRPITELQPNVADASESSIVIHERPSHTKFQPKNTRFSTRPATRQSTDEDAHTQQTATTQSTVTKQEKHLSVIQNDQSSGSGFTPQPATNQEKVPAPKLVLNNVPLVPKKPTEAITNLRTRTAPKAAQSVPRPAQDVAQQETCPALQVAQSAQPTQTFIIPNEQPTATLKRGVPVFTTNGRVKKGSPITAAINGIETPVDEHNIWDMLEICKDQLRTLTSDYVESERVVDRLRTRLSAIDSEHATTINKITSEHTTIIERITSEHATSIAALKIDNQSLQAEVDHQRAQLDHRVEVEHNSQSSQKEYDALRQEHEVLRQEYEALRTQMNTEREVRKIGKETMRTDIADLRREQAASIKAIGDLHDTIENVRQERDSVTNELETMRNDHEALASENENLGRQVAELSLENEAIGRHNEELKTTLFTLAHQADQMKFELDQYRAHHAVLAQEEQFTENLDLPQEDEQITGTMNVLQREEPTTNIENVAEQETDEVNIENVQEEHQKVTPMNLREEKEKLGVQCPKISNHRKDIQYERKQVESTTHAQTSKSTRTTTTTQRVKKTLIVPKPVPASKLPVRDGGNATVRPSCPPGLALGKVLKQLQDEVEELKMKSDKIHSLWRDNDARMGQAERQMLSRKLEAIITLVETKSGYIYNLTDVLEGQVAAGQEMTQELVEVTLQSIGPDPADLLLEVEMMNIDDLPWGRPDEAEESE